MEDEPMPKMTGARLFAEMMRDYEVSHIFFVPAFMLKSFAEMEDMPIARLVPLMSNSGLHHIPVVDGEGVFVGIVSQSDLLAAVFESRLAQAA